MSNSKIVPPGMTGPVHIYQSSMQPLGEEDIPLKDCTLGRMLIKYLIKSLIPSSLALGWAIGPGLGNRAVPLAAARGGDGRRTPGGGGNLLTGEGLSLRTLLGPVSLLKPGGELDSLLLYPRSSDGPRLAGLIGDGEREEWVELLRALFELPGGRKPRSFVNISVKP